MPVNEIILKIDLQKHDRMATAKETAEQVVRQTFCASTHALRIYLKSDNSFLTCDSGCTRPTKSTYLPISPKQWRHL